MRMAREPHDNGVPSSTPTEDDTPARVVRAGARSRITMLPETVASVVANEMKKGDVLGAARFAGVQAAKDAASYLPLIDPELVALISITFDAGDDAIEVTTSVEAATPMGARMRALTGATVATLTIYDMCKSADRTMQIGPVELLPGS
jgi:cyclic pyranopterin monophosphate synthase